MSTSFQPHVSCPQCGYEVALTASARLQAGQLGVSCICPSCAGEWVHKTDAPITHHVRRITHEPASDKGPSNRPPPPNTVRESVVYIVDDDIAVRDSLDCMLTAAGLNVELYCSADDFLSDCRLERPGCLLLDLHMPGMGGLELQQQLRRMQCSIPVLIMTGEGDVAMAVQALKDGAFDFFEKPIDPLLLVSRIQQAIEHDRQTQRDQASALDEPILEQLIEAENHSQTPAFIEAQPSRQPAELPLS